MNALRPLHGDFLEHRDMKFEGGRYTIIFYVMNYRGEKSVTRWYGGHAANDFWRIK